MKTSVSDIMLLFTFPAIMSVGQIMFREAAVKFSGKPIDELILGLLRTPLFHAALAFYAVATIFWVWLLSRYSLSLAYPIAAFAVVFTPIIDRFFFQQHVPLTYWPGLALVICGVIVIVRSH